jgi:membrane-associated phospholipid phosphatase
MHRVVAVGLLLWLPARPAPAQTAQAVRYRVSWLDAASVSAGGILYFTPSALGLPHSGPSCAPCDPATLPGIDRWALRPVSNAADVGSDVALAAVVGWTALAGLGGLPAAQWQGNLVTFANTASWTAATTEWLKVLVRRKRPVLYTSDAAAAATVRDNQLSMPGGHAALAFAAATSYLVVSGREHLAHRKRNVLLLYAGAVGVGALRVAAGQHFPTDIIAGAALGSGIGWLVPTIHPTTRQR